MNYLNTYVMNKITTLLIVCVFIGNTAMAWHDNSKIVENSGTNAFQEKAANCAPASTLSYLEYNNVRALIETGGSMWQNRSTSGAAYEIPAGSGYKVIYSGALWMGGVDVNNQLKIAALTYRQGNDFWTGPLSTTPGSGNPALSIKDYGAASIEPETCLEYDNFYITTKQDVAEFNAYYECSQNSDCDVSADFEGYTIPTSILNWPAHGSASKFQDHYLAPFYDRNEDGVYNPQGDGDYPWYDLDNSHDCKTDRRVTLYGDYNMWWVFNDKGNIHTETNGDPIGMEIRAQAFAFATNDEINNMTFYNYEMINRSTQTLTQTYFAVWLDPDIGCSGDDYSGCDVQRGLGYTYNGDAVDDKDCNGVQPFGANPPAIGVDFFEGPYQDNDGLDNPLTTNISLAKAEKGIPYPGLGIGYGDGVPDNERFGMRRFVYFTIAGGNVGDPDYGIQYYNYMKGIWKDGSAFTYGGTGHGGTLNTDYCFPGDTDPYGWGQNGSIQAEWSELTEGNPVGDRRFVQAAGPFTLQPGALNNITFGVVYARATSGDPFASVELVRSADDKAQALFDNCFRILEGPPAPNLAIQELENELIVFLEGTEIIEQYKTKDPLIEAKDTCVNKDCLDDYYRFQGYQIYQLYDEDVSASELQDVDKARLVAQCDVKDGVEQLINFIFDESLNASVPTEMVDGSDEGIRHSFKFKDDAFAQGNSTLINHKKYYYMAISYGYNNYKTYNPNLPDALDGQQKPYIPSRLSVTGGQIQTFVGIPHNPSPELGGTIINSSYGDTPKITRVEGRGNGGNILEIDPESEAVILAESTPKEVTYERGGAPISVKVVDPLNVKGGDYILKFVSDGNTAANASGLDSATWYLVNGSDTVYSTQTIEIGNEQIIPELGISVNISQYQYIPLLATSGAGAGQPNGKYTTELLTSSMEFADSSLRWLGGVEDADGLSDQNWIRSGTSNEDCVGTDACEEEDPCLYNDFIGVDDDEIWENVVGRTWAPFQLVANSENGECVNAPLGSVSAQASGTAINGPALASSVDIVITANKDKWTRAVVLETQDNPSLSWDGSTKKNEIKHMPSLGKDGNPDGTGTGMSWFPGYAIDLESGERLNIAFGENSWLGNEGGKDMLFNPSGNLYTNFGEALFGGMHYVYVFKNTRKSQNSLSQFNDNMPAYDQGTYLYDKLNAGGVLNIRKAWGSCMWVGAPMLSEDSKGLADSTDKMSYIETDVRIKLRVANAYERHSLDNVYFNDANSLGQSENNWYPMYKFNMDDISTTLGDYTTADSVMALINVVPNPYYAYSNYERDRLENIVKIVNLPDICTVDIYSLDGTLVRSFAKDSEVTSIDWDLNNNKLIPIASGLYLIHVKAKLLDDNGSEHEAERVLKWFGVVRPPDLINF